MSVVQEDDDESPRCVAEWEEVDDELSLSTSTLASASDGVCPTSHRSRHLRQLVVDLKMELAEALAKVDDLTLANRRLVGTGARPGQGAHSVAQGTTAAVTNLHDECQHQC